MENINIEAIIASKSSNIQTKLSAGYKLGGNETLILTEAKAAIKEIVEAVIDKCAEKVDYLEVYNPHISDIPKEAGQLITTYYNPNGADIGYYFDKESILKVKEMINY